MGDRELSRREVLAGIAAVGGSGAVGAASGAIVQDGVTMPGGTVSAGAVDLRVETDGDSGETRSGTIDVTPSADRRSGSRTVTLVNEDNPVYPWIRATCLGDDALSEALGMTLSYVDCQGGTERDVIASGNSFDEFVDEIVDGVALDGDPDSAERSCLSGNGTLCLKLSWTLDEEFSGEIASGFTLEFLGQQCRHNDGRSNPFATTSGSCGGSESPDKDISWVAFCAEDDRISPDDLGFEVDDDTLRLHTAPASIETLLLKYGTQLRVFDDPDPSSTFRTTEGGQTYSQQGSTFPGTEASRSNATPCPGTCGVKYDIIDGEPEVEDRGCSS